MDTDQLATQFWEIIPLVMRVAAADLRRSGKAINPAYFRLLGMLVKGPRTLSDLAERQAVSKPTMSNTVTTLEQRGWVTRERSSQDRRQVWVEITPQGQALLERVHEQMMAGIAEQLEPLTPGQREALAEGLEILKEIFEDPVKPNCEDESG